MRDIRNYSLLRHNTFGIDARCARFLEYGNVDEASQVAYILARSRTPFIIIGGGSNLLLTRDYDGIVVHGAVRGYTVSGLTMTCGSGMAWDDVVDISLRHQLYGAENLSLIPGEVGASAVQNIGAYGAEVKDLILEIHAVETATGREVILTGDECHYGYRYSRLKDDWRNRYLITAVTYGFSASYTPRLDYGNIREELSRRGIQNPTARQLRDVIIGIRRAKLPDPEVTGNAGSFFMNPVVARDKFQQLLAQYPQMPHYPVDAGHEKIPAGWMIDQCGWKGGSLGRAGVHDKQALVLVNRGGATGQEVLRLCRTIQSDVRQRFGIDIQPEVNII